MSKWDWKKLDTYNTIQKILLLSIIVLFILAISMPGPTDNWETNVQIENMLAWLTIPMAFAIYLFKD